MYTQCPECGTIFKVTPEVLRVARGVVRCGVCDATFNAVHYLSAEPAPVPAQGARERAAPRETIPTPTPAGLASLHAQVAAFQAAQPDTFSTGRFAARIASSLREAEHERAWLPGGGEPAREPEHGRVADTDAPAPPAAAAPAPAPATPAKTAKPATPPSSPAPPAPPAPATGSAAELARLRDEQIEAAPDIALEFDPVATDWNTVFISPSRPTETGPVDVPAAVTRRHEDGVAEDTYPSLPAEGTFRWPFEKPPSQVQSLAAQDAPGADDEFDDEDHDEELDEEIDDLPLPASARPDAAAMEKLFRSTAAAAADVQHKAAIGGLRQRGAPSLLQDVPPHDELGEAMPEDLDYDLGDLGGTQVDTPPLQPEPPGVTPISITRPVRTVEPLTLTMPEPVEPSRGYALAAAAALIALALQAGHYWREPLSTLPLAGPFVQRAYEALGHPIEPHWSPTEFDVKQLGASSDVPGTLRLLARIQNKAKRAQPYPLLRVTLLDRFETKIARREFTPAEYLPSRRRPEGLLPSEQRVDADLLLADPGNDAVNYELDTCLYDHNRLVCAQDAQATP